MWIPGEAVSITTTSGSGSRTASRSESRVAVTVGSCRVALGLDPSTSPSASLGASAKQGQACEAAVPTRNLAGGCAVLYLFRIFRFGGSDVLEKLGQPLGFVCGLSETCRLVSTRKSGDLF